MDAVGIFAARDVDYSLIDTGAGGAERRLEHSAQYDEVLRGSEQRLLYAGGWDGQEDLPQR